MDRKAIEARFARHYDFFDCESIALLAERGELITVNAKDFFIDQGRVDRRIGFVVEGLFRGILQKDGEEQNLWFSSDLDILASYNSVLNNSPSKLSYQALSDSVVFTIDYPLVRDLARKDGNLANGMLTLMERLMLESFKRLERYILYSPQDRYLKLLDEKPDIIDRIPQKLLASYIGITPVSLSRMRSRLAGK